MKRYKIAELVVCFVGGLSRGEEENWLSSAQDTILVFTEIVVTKQAVFDAQSSMSKSKGKVWGGP